jgi:radical SAM protein with 4Fe4S-binding SPASM domain
VERLALPPVVRIEPSASCNLACAHCPTGTVEMSRGIMKYEVFERAFEYVKAGRDQIRTVVLYHGGEPLLNKRFGDMVRALKGAGISNVKTVSNGMMLAEGRYDEIIESGIDSIEFSLDGRSPDENNYIRRKSDYDTVIKNVKGFLERLKQSGRQKPKVYISNTQFLRTNDLMAYKNEPQPPAYLLNEFAPYSDMLEYKCTWAMEWPDMGPEIHERFILWVDKDNKTFNRSCVTMDETVTIRSNGDVVACCYDLTSKFILGNVMETSLADIWNGVKYNGLRKSISSGRYVPMCAQCNVIRPPVYLLYKPELEERFNLAAAQVN